MIRRTVPRQAAVRCLHRGLRPARAASAVAALCLVGGLLGCGDEAAQRAPVVDLVAELPSADLGAVRPRVRLADPEPAARLDAGWASPGAASGTVWALGPRATLELFATGRRPLRVGLECGGVPLPPGPPQELTVEVGGEVVGRLPVPETIAGGAAPAVEIPATALAPGWNPVIFELSRWHDPGAPAEGVVDARPLGMRCRALDVRASAHGSPRHLTGDQHTVGQLTGDTASTTESGELVVPVGAGLRYFLDLPPGARLDLRGIETRAARLVVRFETAPDRLGDASTGRAETLELGDGDAAIELGAGRARLELVAQPAPRRWWRRWLGDDEAHVRVASAWITSPAASPSPEASPEPSPEPSPPRAATRPAADRRPNILIYLIDTLRADHLGLYGYERETSPELERLAADGIVFLDARAQTSWTRTAVASIVTGRLPSGHGVDDRDDVLPEQLPTLTESLAEAGWTTVGVTTNGNVASRFGFAQGFEIYQSLRESLRRPEVHQLADAVGAWIETWLGGYLEGGAERPFFLYAHATDPHAPYAPREPFASRFAPGVDHSLGTLETMRQIREGERVVGEAELRAMQDLYDAEIAFVDAELGATLDLLRRHDLYDDTMILVLSDHGEEFREHGGWGHGLTLYEEQLRVPFVLKLPGNDGAGLRLAGRADHVDILPTILDLVGLETPPEIDGRSLLPAIRGAPEPPAEAPSIAELRLTDGTDLSSMVRGTEKLILDESARATAPRRYFDLDDDPGEREDRASTRRIDAGVLESELRRHLERAGAHRPATEETDLDPETREQLEALGYVQ